MVHWFENRTEQHNRFQLGFTDWLRHVTLHM